MANRVNTARAPSYPNVGTNKGKPRKIRVKQLMRANPQTARDRAPLSAHIGVFPFPFGDSQPARNGHHPTFPVGQARRVGAWRNVGTLGHR